MMRGLHKALHLRMGRYREAQPGLLVGGYELSGYTRLYAGKFTMGFKRCQRDITYLVYFR